MYLVIDNGKNLRIEHEDDEKEMLKRVNKLLKQGKNVHICYNITSVNEAVQDIERSQENG